jgi:hypothetical protein
VSLIYLAFVDMIPVPNADNRGVVVEESCDEVRELVTDLSFYTDSTKHISLRI